MLSLFAPAASSYQQSLFDLYNPAGAVFAHRHHPLGLAPLLDHASLLNRASLLNHPSPLLRTSRFDFSHALQLQQQSHRLDPILDHVLESLGANSVEGFLRAKLAHDTNAQAKRAAIRHANHLAQRQIHEGLLRELESAQMKTTRKAHDQMFTQLRSDLETAHVAEALQADAVSYWHEAGGDSGKLEATLRLPGVEMGELKAVLSDPRHLTMTMTMTARGEEGRLEHTVALPFAVRDPAAIELVHDEEGGIVTVRLAKPADEASSPEPVALPIVALATAELDKTKGAAGTDPKVEAATEWLSGCNPMC